MTSRSLRPYTAAIQVIREKTVLSERQTLRVNEGVHTISIHFFIPTSENCGGLKMGGNARQEEKLQQEYYWTFRKPMQTAVDFQVLVNKHVSCLL